MEKHICSLVLGHVRSDGQASDDILFIIEKQLFDKPTDSITEYMLLSELL